METDIRIIIPYNLQYFAKDGPGGEKTEDATAKKLKDAREEGQVAKSKELTSAVELITLFIMLKLFIGSIGTNLMNTFMLVYNKIPDVVIDSGGGFTLTVFEYLMRNVLVRTLMIAAPIFIIGCIVSFIISLYQVKWKLTLKPLQPKLNKFNPITGFKRILSKDSIFELVKSIAKIMIILIVAYNCVKENADTLFILYDIPLLQAIGLFGNIAINMGLKISFVYLIIGFADYIYQKRKFSEDMKMTKQEVKEEYKNSEGSQEVKSRQRQKMREVSRRRMMQDVPTADVIITNPTHLAIAVRYESGAQSAPVVVAKGEDYLAQKIKEVAKENSIEIVENKPLARALYATVEIGKEIPPELYQAVAEVLAYVYGLKNKV